MSQSPEKKKQKQDDNDASVVMGTWLLLNERGIPPEVRQIIFKKMTMAEKRLVEHAHGMTLAEKLNVKYSNYWASTSR